MTDTDIKHSSRTIRLLQATAEEWRARVRTDDPNGRATLHRLYRLATLAARSMGHVEYRTPSRRIADAALACLTKRGSLHWIQRPRTDDGRTLLRAAEWNAGTNASLWGVMGMCTAERRFYEDCLAVDMLRRAALGRLPKNSASAQWARALGI